MSDPSPPAADLTPEERREAQRYGRLQLVCLLADKAIDLAYLGVGAFLLASPLDGWLATLPYLADWAWLRAGAFLAAVLVGHSAVSFPLSVYSGFVLERQFGLSKLTFRGWLWRYAKRSAIALKLSLAVMLGLFLLIRWTGPYWWIVAASGFFVLSVVLGQLVPVLILPLFYRIERLDSPELSDRLTRLCEGTSLHLAGVYRMTLSDETVKANAMLAGLGRTRRVLLGDTLLDHFTPDEIEVIFAHEVGHHVLRHLMKLLVAGLASSAVGFFACDRLLWLVWSWSGPGLDYAQFPVAALATVMLLLTVFVMLTEPVGNALSRRFERQADRYALRRTGLGEAFVSAFRKLARQNKDDPDPHWLEVFLFHSHPPIAERVKMGGHERAAQ